MRLKAPLLKMRAGLFIFCLTAMQPFTYARTRDPSLGKEKSKPRSLETRYYRNRFTYNLVPYLLNSSLE